MKTIFPKTQDVERKWYVVDAEGEILGRLATKVATILRGKHKPEFAPNQEIGDYVIVINADKVRVTGRKPAQKMYYHHTGYPGQIKSRNYEKMLVQKPTFPVEHAVRGMLPKNRLGRKLFTNLKVYAGAQHPHAAQQPEELSLS
ncbi:MAG: 50S ribosomal protein L13 [Spirochaetales bacterium]